MGVLIRNYKLFQEFRRHYTQASNKRLLDGPFDPESSSFFILIS